NVTLEMAPGGGALLVSGWVGRLSVTASPPSALANGSDSRASRLHVFKPSLYEIVNRAHRLEPGRCPWRQGGRLWDRPIPDQCRQSPSGKGCLGRRNGLVASHFF